MAAGTEKDLALSEARRERHAAGLLGTDKIHEKFMEKLLDERTYYPILHKPARPQHRHQLPVYGDVMKAEYQEIKDSYQRADSLCSSRDGRMAKQIRHEMNRYLGVGVSNFNKNGKEAYHPFF